MENVVCTEPAGLVEAERVTTRAERAEENFYSSRSRSCIFMSRAAAGVIFLLLYRYRGSARYMLEKTNNNHFKGIG